MKYFDRTRDQRLIRWKKAIHSFTFIDPMSPDSRNQPEWANNVTKNCRREEWIVIVQFTKLMVPIQLLRWVTTTWCGVLQTFHQRFIFVFLLRFPFGFIDKNLFYSNAIVSIHRMILLLMIQQRHQVAYKLIIKALLRRIIRIEWQEWTYDILFIDLVDREWEDKPQNSPTRSLSFLSSYFRHRSIKFIVPSIFPNSLTDPHRWSSVL